MDRTFHQRITIGAVCGIIITLALAIYAFWIKSILLGLLMVFFLIVISERTLHSEYIFHGKELIIYHGRFSKSRHILLSSIHSCKPMASVFGVVRYLLIGYGNDNVVSVQPNDEQAFVEVLKKRKMRDEDED